jgi:hypothetical protein
MIAGAKASTKLHSMLPMACSDAFIFGEGRAALARRQTSRDYSLPPGPGRAAPPICSDLSYDRHNQAVNSLRPTAPTCRYRTAAFVPMIAGPCVNRSASQQMRPLKRPDVAAPTLYVRALARVFHRGLDSLNGFLSPAPFAQTAATCVRFITPNLRRIC